MSAPTSPTGGPRQRLESARAALQRAHRRALGSAEHATGWQELRRLALDLEADAALCGEFLPAYLASKLSVHIERALMRPLPPDPPTLQHVAELLSLIAAAPPAPG